MRNILVSRIYPERGAELKMQIRVRRTDPLRGLTDDGWIAQHNAGVSIPDWMRYKAHEPDPTWFQRFWLLLRRLRG